MQGLEPVREHLIVFAPQSRPLRPTAGRLANLGHALENEWHNRTSSSHTPTNRRPPFFWAIVWASSSSLRWPAEKQSQDPPIYDHSPDDRDLVLLSSMIGMGGKQDAANSSRSARRAGVVKGSSLTACGRRIRVIREVVDMPFLSLCWFDPHLRSLARLTFVCIPCIDQRP